MKKFSIIITFLMAVILHAPAATLYVDLNSTNPVPPYSTWSTAAANIQDAVDASTNGDLILVTNGVYATGGRTVNGFSLTNRVAVTKPVTLRSVNGPLATIIQGYQVPGTTNGNSAVRCVYMTNGATISGFTLTNGATLVSGDFSHECDGGGVWCESASAVIINCLLTQNAAYGVGGGGDGGGTYSGTLTNCTLLTNTALNGGGAYSSTLDHCILTGNSAGSFGGAGYSILNDCILNGNSASFDGGGAGGDALTNCTLTANSAGDGGGVVFATLSDCSLKGNSAGSGGAAYYSTLMGCTLVGNSAGSGGGAFHGTLTNCTLSANSASGAGGGADSSTLANCTLTGNSAGSYGGGAYSATLINCAVNDNSANDGGGTYGASLNNCTLTGNSARDSGGGSSGDSLNNCIVYYNLAQTGANYSYDTLTYCCTTPLPAGVGNIANEPQLASPSHLSAISPCLDAGSFAYASGVDIDGETWADPPSMGCDEYRAGTRTGPLTVAIRASYTNVAVGFKVSFEAQIDGQPSMSRWDFGDGTIVSNRPYISHGWSTSGVFQVTLTAFNETHPAGISAKTMVFVTRMVHYVTLTSTNPLPPFTSWDTAARNIQDAVDAASLPGALILVTNGVYKTGGRTVNGYALTNRVVIDKPVRVQSLNGPAVTAIEGNGARCVYMTNGAVLAGFTLTNGTTLFGGDEYHEQSGGGVWSEWLGAEVTNCVLTHNWARYAAGGAYAALLENCSMVSNTATYGGGTFLGTLNNCTLTGNSANYGAGVYGAVLNGCVLIGNSSSYTAGGADDGTLNNCALIGNYAYTYGGGVSSSALNGCTLVGNSSQMGGGTYSGTLNNCIVYYNTALSGSNCTGGTLNYCCTAPLPTNGIGNITNEPAFVNLAGGDFHLQSQSPCINSGNNTFVSSTTDLDGNPRIVGGTVDMGAYEYQTPASIISYAWLQQYGLPTDGSVDYADLDGTGFNVYQDWIAGLNPTNSLSVLAMLPPVPTNNPAGLMVSWQSVSNRTYFLQSSINLAAQPAFSTLQSNIVGQPNVTSFMDTNAIGKGPFFYRVGVEQ